MLCLPKETQQYQHHDLAYGSALHMPCTAPCFC